MNPCPFCNSVKLIVQVKLTVQAEDRPDDFSKYTAFVRCEECRARGPAVTDWLKPKFEEIAVERWNGLLKRSPVGKT